jgi:hypothetical protein
MADTARVSQACQCGRHDRACVVAITQEDLLCDSCRQPGCVLVTIDGLLTGHAKAPGQVTRGIGTWPGVSLPAVTPQGRPGS